MRTLCALSFADVRGSDLAPDGDGNAMRTVTMSMLQVWMRLREAPDQLAFWPDELQSGSVGVHADDLQTRRDEIGAGSPERATLFGCIPRDVSMTRAYGDVDAYASSRRGCRT